jgi:hypothetical protein
VLSVEQARRYDGRMRSIDRCMREEHADLARDAVLALTIAGARDAVRAMAIGGGLPGSPPSLSMVLGGATGGGDLGDLGVMEIGQSNIGQANPAEEPVDHNRNQAFFWELASDDATPQPAAEPVHVERPETVPRFGFAVAMMNRLRESGAWRGRIWNAATAHAGSAIHVQWLDDGGVAQATLLRAKARFNALVDPSWPAFGVIRNGETEATHPVTGPLYGGRLANLITWLRSPSGLNRAGMLWIVASLCATSAEPPENYPEWNTVRAAQLARDGTDSGRTRYCESEDGLWDDSGKLHTNGASQIASGVRYANKAIEYRAYWA